MNQGVLQQLLPLAKSEILPLIMRGINAAGERHRTAEHDGADEFSYGTDVWSLPARLFVESQTSFSVSRAKGCVLSIEVESPSGERAAFRLRHHRVGQTETDEILTSFPKNAKALVDEASSLQLPLFEEPEFRSSEDCISVALAFMANPTDGLCALYLCEVGDIEDGHIVAWGENLLVYKRGMGAEPEPERKTMAVEEKTHRPRVRRKKDFQKDDSKVAQK